MSLKPPIGFDCLDATKAPRRLTVLSPPAVDDCAISSIFVGIDDVAPWWIALTGTVPTVLPQK
jgi:hypothetical protein